MAELTGSRVLVTGAAGFLGANMVYRLLDEGAEVYALLRPGTDLWRLTSVAPKIHQLGCDLLDFEGVGECVSKITPQIIYHCAFPGGYPSTPVSQINMLSMGLVGTYAILYAAHKTAVKRFIHLGSSTEYGLSDQPHCESNRLEPGTIRGVSKAASTLLCRQFAREHRMKAVILRLFSVYGPWEQAKRLIPTTCRAILQNHPLNLTPRGIMHDWIFIDDVIEASLAAVTRDIPCGEIINIGSGEQHPNEEVVRILGEVANREIAFIQGAYPSHSHDTKHMVADILHARNMLGWNPRHSLHNGLSATFRFWKEFLSKDHTGRSCE